MERGARKVPRHQRGQYELRLPSKPKRPVTVRAPGRRHHWPHPGQEVLPPGLPQTPSPTHQQRRSGKKQQVVVAIISEQNENYSPPYNVAPIFQTATTFQKTNPVDPPSSSLLPPPVSSFLPSFPQRQGLVLSIQSCSICALMNWECVKSVNELPCCACTSICWLRSIAQLWFNLVQMPQPLCLPTYHK